MAPKIRHSHDDYTAAWICAIPVEMAAAEAMLDEIHEALPVQSNDHNAYLLGRIGEHNVVIACLPSGKYGTVSASSVVVQLLSSFRSIRFGLMVGIGGAVPVGADIRLGDIVVSKPTNTHGGVIEYDFGKIMGDGKFHQTGALNRPPQILLTALSKLQAHHISHAGKFLDFYAELESRSTGGTSIFARPAMEDRLYLSDYVHLDPESPTCAGCDASKTVSRPSREHRTPVIHYGPIASANQVVKSSSLRDELGQKLGVYCVEMEAAGIMNNLPSIVIRGICDYADSHKNDTWQGYASAVAAAYAKELLISTSASRLGQEHKYHVPFDLTAASAAENFVGREDELEHLWQYLRPSSQKSRKVAVLHALGGMGKTQLATRFARAHRDDFTATLWLNGKSRETLLQSLSSALSRLPGQEANITARNEEEVKRNATQVLEWLALPNNNHWLLVFDNVDQYCPGTDDGYDVGGFFPSVDHGSILITSRLLRLAELGKSFPLHKLDATHATQLLLQSTGLSQHDLEEKAINRDVAELVEHLDGLPLAITLAGTFIRETGTSFGKYLQYYRESWRTLQSHSSSDRHYEQGNILQTWLVSYHEITKRDPEAAELMLVLAHFDNQDIWFELLQYGAYSPDRPKWYDSVMSDELAFRAKMRLLLGFSFVGAKLQDDSYVMHPVVRDWCLSMSESHDEAQAARLNGFALACVAYMVPTNDNQTCWALQQRLLPHASYVLGRLRSVLFTDNVVFWTSLQCIGNLYAGQCRLNEAEDIYNWALSVCQKDLGPDHESNRHALRIYQSLGLLYDIQARLDEAEEAYKVALAGYTALDPDQLVIPCIMINLGRVYHRHDLLGKAEDMYQRARINYQRLLGPDHISTLDSVDYLATIYISRGLLEMAESICRTALEGKMRTLGPDHTWTLNTIENLAHIFKCQGHFAKAEEMFHQSLAMERIIGPDHPRILNQTYSLAGVYEEQGKYESAEAMYERTLRGYERTLGLNHLYTLNVVCGFGDFCLGRKRLAEAENMYKRAQSSYEKVLGSEHWLTQSVVQKLHALTEAEKPTESTEPPNRGLLSWLFSGW
ncbi:Pfs, NB-ARC and TPR domain protein [Aspergillus recurvatus]